MEKDNSTLVDALLLASSTLTRDLDNSLGAIHGIGLTEFLVLRRLSEAPYQCLRRVDVAEAVGRTASGITRMLLPMEKIGLIEKKANPRDARVSLVRITNTGLKVLEEATVSYERKIEQRFTNLDGQQKSVLKDLLGAIH